MKNPVLSDMNDLAPDYDVWSVILSFPRLLIALND